MLPPVFDVGKTVYFRSERWCYFGEFELNHPPVLDKGSDEWKRIYDKVSSEDRTFFYRGSQETFRAIESPVIVRGASLDQAIKAAIEAGISVDGELIGDQIWAAKGCWRPDDISTESWKQHRRYSQILFNGTNLDVVYARPRRSAISVIVHVNNHIFVFGQSL